MWGIRELCANSEGDPALMELVGNLRDTVYASVGSDEHRNTIRSKVDGNGDQWTPLDWFPEDQRRNVVESIGVFCESIGRTTVE